MAEMTTTTTVTVVERSITPPVLWRESAPTMTFFLRYGEANLANIFSHLRPIVVPLFTAMGHAMWSIFVLPLTAMMAYHQHGTITAMENQINNALKILNVAMTCPPIYAWVGVVIRRLDRNRNRNQNPPQTCRQQQIALTMCGTNLLNQSIRVQTIETTPNSGMSFLPPKNAVRPYFLVSRATSLTHASSPKLPPHPIQRRVCPPEGQRMCPPENQRNCR
jgi:hypothetical protein